MCKPCDRGYYKENTVPNKAFAPCEQCNPTTTTTEYMASTSADNCSIRKCFHTLPATQKQSIQLNIQIM